MGEKGLLDGKRATCFPSFASALANAIKVEDKVVTDDIFITAEGMGVSFAFGLALITVLYGEEKAEEIREKKKIMNHMLVLHIMGIRSSSNPSTIMCM